MRNKYIITILLISILSFAGCAEEAKEEKKVDAKPEISKPEIQTVEFQNAVAGDYVVFGTYEQDNVTDNGKEPVEWLVLTKEDNRLLLISNDVIECRAYQEEREYVTWEECDLRKWMNSEFVDEIFSEEEKDMVQTTEVKADGNEAYKVAAGNDTKDMVFLLSDEEINQYFESSEEMVCYPTKYAIAKGAYISKENGATWWWMRSRGYDEDRVMRVSGMGMITDVGERVDRKFIGVRPAMWIQY